LFYPKKIQDLALQSKWNFYDNWIKSNSYIPTIRVMGVITILIAFLTLYVLIKKK